MIDRLTYWEDSERERERQTERRERQTDRPMLGERGGEIDD